MPHKIEIMILKNKLVSILMILLGFFGCKKHEKPNVVLFLVDDLGWTDLSSYGSKLYQTPNTDQLVSEGVKFTDAYSSCTVCSPTRASILTGKYPASLQCTDWISGHQRPYAKLSVPNWTQHIRDQDVTLAEALKQQGYTTVHIGKWHLGDEEKYWPENHGFDENIGGWKAGMPKSIKKVGGYFTPYNNPRLEDGPEGEYLTERLSQEAREVIRESKDNPFFLNFWLYNVHTPLQAKKELITKYDTLVNPEHLQSNATYAAMVEHMDNALGAVITELKANNLYDNTIIIFASDNGGLLGTKGKLEIKPKVTSNYPLKSGKGDMYEGGVRVPFIVSWPGQIKPGRETDILTSSVDIFPTIFGLLGLKDSLPNDIEGEDLSNYLLKDSKVARDELYWHYPHYHTQGATPYGAIRKGNWKLILMYETDSVALYDLDNDLGEQNNLALTYPEKTAELKALFQKWKLNIKAQEPIVNKNYDSLRAKQWKNNW